MSHAANLLAFIAASYFGRSEETKGEFSIWPADTCLLPEVEGGFPRSEDCHARAEQLQ